PVHAAGRAYGFAAYEQHASPFPPAAPQSLASCSTLPPAIPATPDARVRPQSAVPALRRPARPERRGGRRRAGRGAQGRGPAGHRRAHRRGCPGTRRGARTPGRRRAQRPPRGGGRPGGALAPLAADGRIDHRAGTFAPEALDDAWLAIAATDDPQVNRAVAEAGQARRVWVNVVDDAELARVHLPARVERGPLQVAISSGGGSPMLARLVGEQLERQCARSLGGLAALLARQRARLLARWPDADARRRAVARLLSGPLPGLLRRGRHIEAARELERALDAP